MIPSKRDTQEYNNYIEVDSRVKTFLSYLGITDATITSVWRKGNQNSQHSDASAIDIQSDQLVLLLRSGNGDVDWLAMLAESITGDIKTDPFRQVIIEHHRKGMLTRKEAANEPAVIRTEIVNGKKVTKCFGSNMTVFHMAIYSDKFIKPVDANNRVCHSLRYDTYGYKVAGASKKMISKAELASLRQTNFELT